mgnify:CR=1 FL=1
MTLFADTAGERLDAFLARSELNLSRSAAQKLLDEGCVTLNGKAGKKNDRLTPGDTVEVTLPEPKEIDVEARDIPLDIVYEDEDVVVINKPKGLVVHPAPGHQDDTLVNGLLYALGDSLSGINGELRPGIVHRIDKDTSGLLAVAKNDLAHAVLASQLVDHTMARTYEAIVCGTLKEDSGTVDAPIGRHPTDRKRMAVTQKNARRAVEAVQALPLDRILIETDCPYMAPEPHRGTRNDSSNLSYVAARIAEIKGVSVQEVEQTTWENACRVFSVR